MAESRRVEAMRRQLDELDALRATWPEAGAVVLCREEEAVVEAWRRHVHPHTDVAGAVRDVPREALATLSYVVSPPDCRGVTFAVSLPCTYPLEGRAAIRADVPGATRARTAHLQRIVDDCASAWEGCECVHAAVAAVQDAVDDVLHLVDVDASVPRVPADEEADEEATCSIRALWFHHVYARGKRAAMAAWAKELHVRGWCLVGRPGALVALGGRDDTTAFVQRVKRLRWQAVAERHAEDEVVRRVGVDVQHVPEGWMEIHGERGFAQLAERCRRAGLARVVQALVRHDA